MVIRIRTRPAVALEVKRSREAGIVDRGVCLSYLFLASEWMDGVAV